jgi:hypothetical protein
MNTNVSLSQVTKSLEWVWNLERIWSFVLCLGVKSRALVLNAMAKNLDVLKWWWLEVFIAPTTKPTVGVGLLSMGAPDSQFTEPCHQPLGFDRWSSDSLGHRTVRWCTGQSLFTVQCAFWRLLWLCATVRALCTYQPTVEVEHCA